MKRFLYIILLLFITVNTFATLGESPASSRGFKIEGGVGKYNQINITPIYSISSDSITGFPFDITGSDVKYTSISGGGRQIATWSVATNYANVTINISATDLCYEDNSISLPYVVVFHIMYASYNENGSFKENIHKDFVLDTSKEISRTITIDNSTSYEPFPVVSYDQDIRFYFAENINPSDKKYPYGYYSSTITISVSGD